MNDMPFHMPRLWGKINQGIGSEIKSGLAAKKVGEAHNTMDAHIDIQARAEQVKNAAIQEIADQAGAAHKESVKVNTKIDEELVKKGLLPRDPGRTA